MTGLISIADIGTNIIVRIVTITADIITKNTRNTGVINGTTTMMMTTGMMTMTNFYTKYIPK